MKRALELMQAIRNVGAPLCSPDGRYVLYSVGVTDMEKNTKSTCDYLYDTTTGQVKPLPGEKKRAKPQWLNDTTLLFQARGGGKEKGLTNFLKLDIESGEESRAFSVPENIEECWQLGEERYLLRGTKDYNALSHQPTDYWVVHTEYPYKSNGNGFISGTRHTLFLYDKGTLVPLTDEKTEASAPVISADKNKIWFWGQRYEGCSYPDDCVYTIDLAECAICEIIPRQECSYGPGVYLGGRLYVVKTPVKANHDLGCHELWSFLPNGGDMRKEFDLSCGNTRMKMMLYDGYIYFTDPECGNRTLKRWKPGKQVEYVADGGIGVENFSVSPAGVFFLGRTPNSPGEIYWLNAGAPICITNLNTGISDAFGLSAAEGYSFQDEDGFTISGWCIKPSRYQAGKKYPGVLFIHGGPSGFFDRYFAAKMQAYAAHGYFVFYCNPRGSGTYGKEHMFLGGQFGTYDFRNLMMFTDETLRRYPDIDPEKLCVTGGSYGGFMTNWIITHCDRFKAAVSIVSTSNWISKLLCCDDSHSKVMILGAAPWEDPEKLWWHSPLRYVKNVKTPTLFVQNEHDYRSPPCEAEMMFTSLCRLGIPSKMIMNYKASHGVMNVAQIKNQMEQAIDWFDEHIEKNLA